MNLLEGSMQAFLFPNKQQLREFRNLLRSTKKSLKICMYQLTDKSIYQILLDLLMENKEVIIVTAYHILGKSEKDKICRQMRSEIFNLLFQFPKTKIFLCNPGDTNKESNLLQEIDQKSFIMHNKFFIIDDQTVGTGSLNFTARGLHQNYENVVVFKNKDISTKFLIEFNKIWCRSSQLTLNPEKKDFMVIHSHSQDFNFPEPIRTESLERVQKEIEEISQVKISFAQQILLRKKKNKFFKRQQIKIDDDVQIIEKKVKTVIRIDSGDEKKEKPLQTLDESSQFEINLQLQPSLIPQSILKPREGEIILSEFDVLIDDFFLFDE